MRPILYEANETDFSSNGLGRPGFTECSVNEVLNGQFELEATLPVSDKHFGDIQFDRIILASCEDENNLQPFEIYDIEKSADDLDLKIKAEHISYRLTHIPVTPFVAKTPQEAIDDLKKNSVVTNPFIFYTDVTNTDANDVLKFQAPASAKSAMGDDEKSGILGVFKSGEWKYDRFKVSLLERRGVDTSVVLRYGKNLSSLTQDENIEDTITTIMPYWSKSEGDDRYSYVYLADKIYDCVNIDKFAYRRINIFDTASYFEKQPSQAELLDYAKRYAKENKLGIPALDLNITFEVLQQRPDLEALHMGDSLKVIFPKLDVAATGEVTEYEWDCLHDRYNSITVGNTTKGLYDTIKNITRSQNENMIKELESPTGTDKDRTKSGKRRVTLTTGAVLLISDLDADAIFGLAPGTADGDCTAFTFTEIGSSQNFTHFYYDSANKGWYGTCTASSGEGYVSYTGHYYGKVLTDETAS